MTAANADDFIHVPPERKRLSRWRCSMRLSKTLGKDRCGKDKATGRGGFQTRPFWRRTRPKSQNSPAHSHNPTKRCARRSAWSERPTGKELAAAVALLNYACGRVGETVDFSQTHALSKTATHGQINDVLSHLTADDILIIHNANLAYSISGAAEHIRRAKRVIYMSTIAR